MSSTDLPSPRTTVPWWLLLLQGIAAILLGIGLLIRPGLTTLLFVQFVGIYWFISGIFEFVDLIADRENWPWKVINGILGIVAGVIVLRFPLASTVAVPVMIIVFLGALGVVIGVIKLIQAFRGAGWSSAIVGALSLLLGLLVMLRSLILGFALPIVIGVAAIIAGIITIVLAFRSR